MNKSFIFVAFIALFLLGGLIAWNQQQTKESPPEVTFNEAYTIIASSCMPCHNRYALPDIIEKTKNATFAAIEEETRSRIVAALEGLQEDIKESGALSFTSQEEIQVFLKHAPGELDLMIERGVMPPPWAIGLMEHLDWKYVPLTPENRVKLIQFARITER